MFRFSLTKFLLVVVGMSNCSNTVYSQDTSSNPVLAEYTDSRRLPWVVWRQNIKEPPGKVEYVVADFADEEAATVAKEKMQNGEKEWHTWTYTPAKRKSANDSGPLDLTKLAEIKKEMEQRSEALNESIKLKPKKKSLDERKRDLDAERDWLIKENLAIRTKDKELSEREKSKGGGPYTIRAKVKLVTFGDYTYTTKSFQTFAEVLEALKEDRFRPSFIGEGEEVTITDGSGRKYGNDEFKSLPPPNKEALDELTESRSALDARRAERTKRLDKYKLDKAKYEADLQQFENENQLYKQRLDSLRIRGGNNNPRNK